MQIILQATHGIVSGSPEFFKRAFGENPAEYESLLMPPERFLFNRVWYEEIAGRAELDDYHTQARVLNTEDREELLTLLSSSMPSRFKTLTEVATRPRVRCILS